MKGRIKLIKNVMQKTNQDNKVLKLCHQKDCCPEVFMDGNMVVLTDDNDVSVSGVRSIKLTKDQFQILMKEGKSFLS